MRLPSYYSTKIVGSYATSIEKKKKNYGYIRDVEILDSDLSGYCKCLDDLGVKYISQSDLREKIYDYL